MIFSVDQVRMIRQGKKTAALVPVTYRLRTGSMRVLRRRVSLVADDGSTSTAVQVVTDPGREPGASEPVVITILAIQELELEQLTFPDARACGFRTRASLLDAWRREHPRSPLARLVRFGLGDLRNKPRLLAPTGAGSDYTTEPHRALRNEPEALTASELAKIAAVNGQSYLSYRAQLAAELSSQPTAERIQRIQRASTRMQVDIRRELRVIEERVARAEKRAGLGEKRQSRGRPNALSGRG